MSANFGILTLLDRKDLAGQLELSLVELGHLFLLGADELVDLGHEIDGRHSVLLQDVLDHEEDQLIG